jgi:predicted nucleotidyltransferase
MWFWTERARGFVMVSVIEEHRADVQRLCQRFGVSRLDVFGSAVTEDRFDPNRSDLDFLVEFEPMDPVRHAKSYFGLLAALQDLFCRDVDLIEIKAVTNPYLLESIDEGRRQIYAA